ncbi:MAG: pantothenate kinase [Pseudanabaena sp.]|nr:MAG: pantothenate kinase [Pseudanabaena sp.]
MDKSWLWLVIAIGNTRIRAVVFNRDRQIIKEYAYAHKDLPSLEIELTNQQFAKISIFSVVANLVTYWHRLAQTQIITTADIPLQNLYANLGVDRALAAFGAGELYGYPLLVIDAGTALTLTGVDAQKNLVGGAIIAGLRSQFITLHQNTSALPNISIPEYLPDRWANNTNSAIESGIAYIFLYGLQAYIDDWRSQFPDSHIILTGGDGDRLKQWGLKIDVLDSYLVFWGVWHCQF